MIIAVNTPEDDYSVEASLLGLAPGEWPERIYAKDIDDTMATYLRHSNYAREGDLLYVTYIRMPAEHGGTFPRTLTIWND